LMIAGRAKIRDRTRTSVQTSAQSPMLISLRRALVARNTADLSANCWIEPTTILRVLALAIGCQSLSICTPKRRGRADEAHIHQVRGAQIRPREGDFSMMTVSLKTTGNFARVAPRNSSSVRADRPPRGAEKGRPSPASDSNALYSGLSSSLQRLAFGP